MKFFYIFLPVFYYIPYISSIDISQLSLEEKIGQMLMVSIQATTCNQTAKKFIKNLHIGGVIYYSWANGLDTAQQVAQLSKELQHCALKTKPHCPLILAIDHEGGRVHWFKNNFTHFPPAYAYGLIDDSSLTQECALAMGNELQAAGISMDLAPCVDILTNPNNPIIGIRSFGTTPERVTHHAQAFIQGLHDAGIATCIKHFPGHGDSATDSHLALPTIPHTLSHLRSYELAPFFALAPYTDCIMTAHLMVPALDTSTCSTLSPKTISMLRDQAHFDGIILTDSMVMQGIATITPSLEKAAIKAVQAGCDMLLLGGRCLEGTKYNELTYKNIANIHHALVQAVQTGHISLQRIDESAQRILRFKQKYAYATQKKCTKQMLATHQKRALAVADKALKIIEEQPPLLPEAKKAELRHYLTKSREVYNVH